MSRQAVELTQDELRNLLRKYLRKRIEVVDDDGDIKKVSRQKILLDKMFELALKNTSGMKLFLSYAFNDEPLDIDEKTIPEIRIITEKVSQYEKELTTKK
jgi:hypothetical protein